MTRHEGPPESDHMAACLVALAHLPGVGPATLLRCHRNEGAVVAWEAVVAGHPRRIGGLAEQLDRLDAAATTRLVQAARSRDLREDLERHRAEGRQVLVHGQPGYPARLLHDLFPPAVLFAQGHVGLLEHPTVAIIGTRNATRPGRDLAEAMGEELAAAGVVVISGLALGIDGSAHRGALAAGPLERAKSHERVVGSGDHEPPLAAVGVIAAGLDVAYPRRHADLHRQISTRGLLLSETPLGSRPVPWRFPARNRVIAALADVLVVVESRATGGSMITVSEALDREVQIMAVPGHPAAAAAVGTNELLYDGAAPVRNAADVLLALGIQPPMTAPGGVVVARPAAPGQRAVLGAIGTSPCALAEVVALTGRSLDDVSADLSALEAGGWITRVGGWYERVAHASRRRHGVCP
ncbi:MAG: DNA-processing protein DprA [Aquihabitans sp.]